MSKLQAAVNKIIADNPDKTQQAWRNPALSGWFVGQVLKLLGGDASVDEIHAALVKRGIKERE